MIKHHNQGPLRRREFIISIQFQTDKNILLKYRQTYYKRVQYIIIAVKSCCSCPCWPIFLVVSKAKLCVQPEHVSTYCTMCKKQWSPEWHVPGCFQSVSGAWPHASFIRKPSRIYSCPRGWKASNAALCSLAEELWALWLHEDESHSAKSTAAWQIAGQNGILLHTWEARGTGKTCSECIL